MAQPIYMELSEDVNVSERYNFYICRFCDFNVQNTVEYTFDNGNVCLELLQNHYITHHPVTKTIVDETTEFYQDGKKIAILSKTHQNCCFENCQNNRTPILKKQLNKLAIRLLHDGVYPQFDIYFDNYHYDLEPYVFACGDLFEETRICSADRLLQWISQYGLMRTFTLKTIVQKKNKNLLMLKRIPKIKDQQTKEEILKIKVQQVKEEINKLIIEKKDIEKRASKCLNFSASLLSQILQLSKYLKSTGHTASFDGSNRLIICYTKTEKETDKPQNKKQRLE